MGERWPEASCAARPSAFLGCCCSATAAVAVAVGAIVGWEASPVRGCRVSTGGLESGRAAALWAVVQSSALFLYSCVSVIQPLLVLYRRDAGRLSGCTTQGQEGRGQSQPS